MVQEVLEVNLQYSFKVVTWMCMRERERERERYRDKEDESDSEIISYYGC